VADRVTDATAMLIVGLGILLAQQQHLPRFRTSPKVPCRRSVTA
jgi:hypothetical protein